MKILVAGGAGEVGTYLVRDLSRQTSIQLMPCNEWQGAAFLNEVWDLSWEKAERDLGFKPSHSSEEMRCQFVKALQKCIDQVKEGEFI
jgi:UDP-glucose 4-epimerase